MDEANSSGNLKPIIDAMMLVAQRHGLLPYPAAFSLFCAGRLVLAAHPNGRAALDSALKESEEAIESTLREHPELGRTPADELN